jgi:hypothetical protein
MFLIIGGSAPVANITEKTDALLVLLHMGGGKNTPSGRRKSVRFFSAFTACALPTSPETPGYYCEWVKGRSLSAMWVYWRGKKRTFSGF